MLSSRSMRRSASVATQAARMSRVRSQSTIYMPPPPSGGARGLSRASSVTTIDESAPSRTTAAPPAKKLTPGRRGEKRKRPLKQQMAEDEEKRRRLGKIASEGGMSAVAGPANSSTSTSAAAAKTSSKMHDARTATSDTPEVITVDDEDIFGNVNRIEDSGANDSAAAKPRSASKSECETKNKAVRSDISCLYHRQLNLSLQSIKKRLLAAMEARNCGRSHVEFKDVFSVANKGVSFALVSKNSCNRPSVKLKRELLSSEAYYHKGPAGQRRHREDGESAFGSLPSNRTGHCRRPRRNATLIHF